MADLMGGTSGYQTGAIDTATAQVNNVSPHNANHINGVAAGIIQIETVLGIGTSLKGTAADLVARLAVALQNTGKLLDFSSTTKVTFPPAVGEGCTGATSFTANGVLLGNGVSPIQVTAAGGASTVLAVGAGGGAPTFSTITDAMVDWANIVSAELVLDRDATDVLLDFTSSEVTLYSFSVPGGTLGTNRMIVVQLFFTNQGSTGGDTATIRCKYGSTTVVTLVPVGVLPLSNGVGHITFYLYADGATGSQRGLTQFLTEDHATPTQVNEWHGGTASEDSTSAKTLAITCQWSTAGSGRGLHKRHAVMTRR